MTAPTEPRPERSGAVDEPGDEARRRREAAVEIVVDGLLTLLLRERREQREAREEGGESIPEEHQETRAGRVRVAGRGERSAVSTDLAESPATR